MIRVVNSKQRSALAADVKKQITVRSNGMARPGVELAERVRLCGSRLSEKPVP